jgi:hypothetical protein
MGITLPIRYRNRPAQLSFCRKKDKLLAPIAFFLRYSIVVYHSEMRKVLLLFVLIWINFSVRSQTVDAFFSKTDYFMKTYVTEGTVKYENIHKVSFYLDELVKIIQSIDPETLNGNTKKAYLINTYNILVIKGIIDHFPIGSPQDVLGFFDAKKYNIGGDEWTLDQIEKKQLNPHKDNRLHFVLVCGALGCPPLANYAYTPDQLETQLEKQTRLALNDDNFIYSNSDEKKNYLSEIFKWYADDFEGTINFINGYRNNQLNPEFKRTYYAYDWQINRFVFKDTPDLPLAGGNHAGIVMIPASNIQTYTPSALLKQGQFETQLFSNLYTQTQFRDENRTLQDAGGRQTYFSELIYVLYGVSKNRRFNAGMDINIKAVHLNSDKNSSMFKVFGFASDENSRTALASLGPKVKWAPFEKVRFSIQSAFWIPVADDLEADKNGLFNDDGSFIHPQKPWLDYNRYTWWNQLFFDHSFGSNFQLFAEFDFLFRFAKDASKYANNVEKDHQLSTPVSLFISYFPSTKITTYGMIQYAPTYGSSTNSSTLSSDYAQFGLGMKYQATSQLQLELLYSNFFTSMNGGAGQTFNLGIRYIGK